jgi:uncharacterized protein YndB with AHSA1/START domain
MSEICTSKIIEAPAEAVWALLADFGNIEAWWPNDGDIRIEQVEVEGHGIGMVRHIKNAGVEKRVSERLDYLDPPTMTWMLSIVGTRPLGITAYVAIGRITPLALDHCRLDYRVYVTTEPGREKRVEQALRFTWGVMFSALEAAARA